MSFLMMAYDLLREAEVVQSAEEFSSDWCQRSPSWYANRKHAQAEFSIAAAICCNSVANLYLEVYSLRRDASVPTSRNAREAVMEVRDLTANFLERRHRITQLAPTIMRPINSE